MSSKLNYIIPFVLLSGVILTPRIDLISISGIASKVRLESLFSGLNLLLVVGILFMKERVTKAFVSPYLQIGIVLFLVSISVSGNYKSSVIYFLKYLELFSFFISGFLLAYYTRKSSNLHVINLLLIAIVISLTFLDMFDINLISVYNNFDGGIAKGRVSASFNLNYDLGAFLGLVLLQIWIITPVNKIIKFAFSAVLAVFILLIGSRSTQLAILITLTYLLLIHEKNDMIRHRFFISLLLAIPLLLTMIIINGVQDPSIAHRIFIWTTIIQNMDLINFLFGGGAGFINITMSAVEKPGTAAESFYFRLLFEHGALGILLYLFIIYKWYIGRQNKNDIKQKKFVTLENIRIYQCQKMISAIVIFLMIFGIFIDINLSTKFGVYCYFSLGTYLGIISWHRKFCSNENA